MTCENTRGCYLRGDLTRQFHFSSEQKCSRVLYRKGSCKRKIPFCVGMHARMLLCSLYRINRQCWLIARRSANRVPLHDNLKINPFTWYSPLRSLASFLELSIAILSLLLSLLPFSTPRSIPALLINKSYPRFLLLAVSFEKLASYLTAGTRRRRTRTLAVFHSLVFTRQDKLCSFSVPSCTSP